MTTRLIQNRAGIPDLLSEEKRFFELRGPQKTDTPLGWNKPENWKYLEDIPEGVPFGCVLIGNGSTKAEIDYDHVIDNNGKMVGWAYRFYRKTVELGGTYTELSMSSHGLHQTLELGDLAETFDQESNDNSRLILDMPLEEYLKLSKEERDQIPKIELYLHGGGHNFILTGQEWRGEQWPVATDEKAAIIWHEALTFRAEMQAKHNKKNISSNIRIDKSSLVADEATKQLVIEALPYISADDRETWIRVGQACSNIGIPFEIWDEWSKWQDQKAGTLCTKYNEKETPYIWKSFERTSSRWNAGTIISLAKENGFIPPGSRRQMTKGSTLLLPEFSDVAQAKLFAAEYGNVVRYSKATRFLKYSGKLWEESDLKVQRLSQELTERQLNEARKKLSIARSDADKVAEGLIDKGMSSTAKAAVVEAEAYRKEIVKRRDSKKINATLAEAAPLLEVDVRQLDRDGFILNTPGGTVDLKTGEVHAHNPEDYCTKITAVTPDTKNMELFREFLEQITCHDKDLERYLQEIAGVFAVGEVKREEIFIAVGEGGNGKSTFFNLLYKVFGDYAGLISSDVLIMNSKKNKSPELAELRGKRFILAAELDEGTRLDTAIIKKLASTDPIRAEKKYKDPFDFIPSHSIVLYTNHLPKVGARDSGTWDRLRVIPFNATFRNTTNEVKDYASVLFDQCGGAVMSWVIEGAKRYIANKYQIEQPECVRNAIDDYRKENDWLQMFLTECCYVGRGYVETGGNLYKGYREFCTEMGEFTRSAAEFKKALESVGIEHRKTMNGAVYRGIELKTYAQKIGDIQAAKRST